MIPLGRQLADLRQDVLRPAGALTPPDVGHDAVGAKVVAAVHDGHPGLHPARPAHRQPFGNGSVGVLRLKHPPSAQVHPVEQLGELPQSMGAEHQVHMPIGLAQLLHHMGLLGHAAAQADDLVGVAPLPVDQRAHVSQHPLLGMLPDGAGVDDDDIGVLVRVRHLIAHLRQHAPDQLRVRLILLTPIGVHIGGGGVGQPAVQGPDLGAVFPLAPDLLLGYHRGGSIQCTIPP